MSAIMARRASRRPRRCPARASTDGRYVTPRITIDITRAECSDGMSDRRYPERVMVTVGRKTVRGCGGDPIVAPSHAPVIEGNWRIESIEGRPVRGPRPATIAFNGNRISGHSGCNGFGGSFRFDHGRLIAGPMISTKMACPGPAMAQEQALMRLLRSAAQRQHESRGQAGPERIRLADPRAGKGRTRAVLSDVLRHDGTGRG